MHRSTVKHFQFKTENKSGNTPITLSEQILSFQAFLGFLRLGVPGRRVLKDVLSLSLSLSSPGIALPPERLGTLSFLERVPLNGAARAGHENLDSTEGASER